MAVEVILSLPVAVALAYSVAHRLRTRRWWLPRARVMAGVVVPYIVAYLLRYYAIQTGQSSPSDAMIGEQVSVLATMGIGLLVVASGYAIEARSKGA